MFQITHRRKYTPTPTSTTPSAIITMFLGSGCIFCPHLREIRPSSSARSDNPAILSTQIPCPRYSRSVARVTYSRLALSAKPMHMINSVSAR